MSRRKRDQFTKKAKKEGFRSRAAYKIEEIDKKFDIFKPGRTYIDLCGAPGGFSQIARDRTLNKSRILLVDLARIREIPGVRIIKGDITNLVTIKKIRSILDEWGRSESEIVVMADCSPKVSGSWNTDHEIQIWLSKNALGIANYYLAKIFITKVFQGMQYKSFLEEVNKFYSDVKAYKPSVSRTKSAETYIIAKKRKNQYERRFNEDLLYLDEE